MTESTHIQARVSPELVEQFQLAAKLSGRSASAVLRDLMRLYVERATDPGNGEDARVRTA